MDGNMDGNMNGNTNGSMNGNMNGNTNGSMNGNMNGSMNGNMDMPGGVGMGNNGMMNPLQMLEMEMNEICQRLGEYTFSTLLERRISYSRRINEMKLQSPAITNMDHAIYQRLLQLQNEEVLLCQNKIAAAGLDELDGIRKEITEKGYAQQATQNLLNLAYQRMCNCQMELLEQKLSGCEGMNRQELHKLSDEIQTLGYEQRVVSGYVQRLTAMEIAAEQSELQELCKNVENSDLDELARLKETLDNGGYRVEYSTKYYDMINNRVDYIYSEKMRTICKNIDVAGRNEIAVMKGQIDELDCRENLKLQFYNLITKRVEVLDYDELASLTNNLEELEIQELLAVREQIETGNYSQKFLKQFILKVNLQLEKKEYLSVQEQADAIDSLNRMELMNMYHDIESKKYEERVTRIQRNRIESKIYELDMKKIMDTCNDFDSLSRDQIMQLSMKIEQMDISQESKDTFFSRLAVRKRNLALENIVPYAYLFNQMAQNYQVSSSNIKLATFSQDYLEYYEQLKANCDSLGEYEVPVFIMTGNPYVAISTEKVFCGMKDGLHIFTIEEVHSFGVVGKLFTSTLNINLRNGQSLPLPGNVGKGGAVLANMFSQFLQAVPNPMEQTTPVRIHTDNFAVEEFASNAPKSLDWNLCAGNFVASYTAFVNKAGNAPLKLTNTKEWSNKENKIRNNYGITSYEPVLAYYEGSFFGGNKDGLAIGQNSLFVKRAGMNANIRMEQIYQICVSPGNDRIQVEVTDNNVFIIECIPLNPEMAQEFAKLLNDYVKSVQLVKMLENAQNTEGWEEPVQPEAVQIMAETGLNMMEQQQNEPEAVQGIAEPVPSEPEAMQGMTEPVQPEAVQGMTEPVQPEAMQGMTEPVQPETIQGMEEPAPVGMPVNLEKSSEIPEVIEDSFEKDMDDILFTKMDQESSIPEMEPVTEAVPEPVTEAVPESVPEPVMEPEPVREVKFCRMCGKGVSAEMIFCKYCGTKINR